MVAKAGEHVSGAGGGPYYSGAGSPGLAWHDGSTSRGWCDVRVLATSMITPNPWPTGRPAGERMAPPPGRAAVHRTRSSGRDTSRNQVSSRAHGLSDLSWWLLTNGHIL